MLKNRLILEFFIMQDRTVNYESICEILAEVYYVILVVLSVIYSFVFVLTDHQLLASVAGGN